MSLEKLFVDRDVLDGDQRRPSSCSTMLSTSSEGYR
jgi:hypothetical protein